MIRIRNVRVPFDAETDLRSEAARKLHIGEKKQGKDKSKSPYLPVSLIG